MSIRVFSKNLLLPLIIAVIFTSCYDDIGGVSNGSDSAGTSALVSLAGAGKTWAKIYYGDDETATRAVEQTGDGNFIILTGNDIVKIDPAGTILWQKHASLSSFVSIAETVEGDLIAAGHQSVIKLDAFGNVIWSKEIVCDNSRYVYFTRLNYDKKSNTFAVDGVIYNNDYTEEDFVLKIDCNGALITKKVIKTYFYDYGHSRIASDGGIIKAGNTPTDDNPLGLVTKIKPDGAIEWQKTYGAIGGFRNLKYGETETYAVSIENTSDGGYMLLGVSRVFQNEIWFAWLARLDAKGNRVWAEEIYNITGGSNINLTYLVQNYADMPVSIQAAADGGYALMGNSQKTRMLVANPTEQDLTALLYQYNSSWIVKLDAAGKIVWQKQYMDKLLREPTDGDGGNITFYRTSISMNSFDMISSGGYILGGSTNEYTGTGNYSSLVLKTDSKGAIANTDLKVQSGSASIKKIDVLATDTQKEIDESSSITLVDQPLEMTIAPGYSVLGI